VLALLLEGRDAIAVWRRLLGPGDPSIGRRSHRESIRALYGSNKLANAAHGADCPAAAAREIAFVFGERAVQLGDT
jgi:nucleoside-diphosphate kinase